MGRSGKTKKISPGLKTTRGAIFENEVSLASPENTLDDSDSFLKDSSSFLKSILEQRDQENIKGLLLKVNHLIDENITNEDLSGIDFSLAQIKGTSIEDVVFNKPEKSDFNSPFSGAFFFQSEIKGSVFSGCLMKQAAFEETGVFRCDFREVDLTGADLSGGGSCRFVDSNFANSSLEGVIFSDGDFKKSSFIDCTFSKNANFQGAVLTEAAFLSSSLKSPDFIDVSARDCSFSDIDFPKGGFFDRSVLPGARFSAIRSDKLSFIEADLRGAVFKNSNFPNANFNQANLRGAVFSNVDLRGVDFRGADLKGVRFAGCNLEGAHVPEDSGAVFS